MATNSDSANRANNPPGGPASNIFGPPEENGQQRKVRDHQKSRIFSQDQVGSVKRFLSPRYQENTKNRLFGGESDVVSSPRRTNDTWRSNVVFSASVDSLSDEATKRTPRRSPSAGINPITGAKFATPSAKNQHNHSSHINGEMTEPEANYDSMLTNGKTNGQENGKEEESDEKEAVNGRANDL